ncbi:MAG TPA: ABC transporter ATP-binding protein [Balneolaceae bacterium]|nr:ABC transporter ATP-binding protein [Balneolaceae bacterium]
MNTVIQLKELTKQFGSQLVLNSMNLEIIKGHTTGIVGPNGSGKTTMIKHLLGLVKPDSGSIHIDGKKLNGHWDYRQDIGYMPQIAQYPENMKVNELIGLIKEIRSNQDGDETPLIKYFGLEPELGKRLQNLSGGTRQKVGAVLALMFNASILILDEPTAGLDPQASHKLKQLIQHEKEKGKTILLTTHIMSEIEELADNIIFIVEGNLRYNGPMKEFIENQQEQRLEGAVAKMMERGAK